VIGYLRDANPARSTRHPAARSGQPADFQAEGIARLI